MFQAPLPRCAASAEVHTLICDMQRRGRREDDEEEEEEEEEEAHGIEVWRPAEVICLGSYRAYLHCWQSYTG